MKRHIITFCCACALFAAGHAFIPGRYAAAAQHTGASASGERHASAETSSRKRAAARARRKAAYQASRRRKAAAHFASPTLRRRYAKSSKAVRFRTGEHDIAQIPSRLRSSAPLSLDGGRPNGCRARRGKHSACFMSSQRKRFPDILLEAPTPESAAILERAGIPTVKDVPPVVIIFPEKLRGDERFLEAIR
jgi:hypothetical protein